MAEHLGQIIRIVGAATKLLRDSTPKATPVAPM
jgi:hypothetical protein